MAADPYIDLIEASFQGFFVLAEEVIRGPGALYIHNESEQLILVKCALILPRTHCCDHISAVVAENSSMSSRLV
jgi:hypothetical protein